MRNPSVNSSNAIQQAAIRQSQDCTPQQLVDIANIEYQQRVEKMRAILASSREMIKAQQGPGIPQGLIGSVGRISRPASTGTGLIAQLDKAAAKSWTENDIVPSITEPVRIEEFTEEQKQKIKEKLEPFEKIVAPNQNQKQEHHIEPPLSKEQRSLASFFTRWLRSKPVSTST